MLKENNAGKHTSNVLLEDCYETIKASLVTYFFDLTLTIDYKGLFFLQNGK